MKKIGLLEQQSDKDNPDWIPQVGEWYAWRARTTRTGNLIKAQVISYDSSKSLVRGRSLNGMTERRHLSDVFKLAKR